jgi:hypothetical protein
MLLKDFVRGLEICIVRDSLLDRRALAADQFLSSHSFKCETWVGATRNKENWGGWWRGFQPTLRHSPPAFHRSHSQCNAGWTIESKTKKRIQRMGETEINFKELKESKCQSIIH